MTKTEQKFLNALKDIFVGAPAETLSCVTGKWIRRITAETVEFEDGDRVDLHNPDWNLVKPLIWW